MAKIKKIQEGGETIYPATITNAIKDVESGETLAEILENKANVDGTYPEMEVGAAYDVINDGSFTSEEISFRPSGGTNRNVKVNGVARIEKIKGNSIVYNQRACEYNISDKYFKQVDRPPVGYWRFYTPGTDYKERMNWHDGILSLTLIPDTNYQGALQTEKVYPLGTKILCLQKVRYTYNDTSLGTAMVYDGYSTQITDYVGLPLNDGEWLETATIREVTKEVTSNTIGCRISNPRGGGIFDIAYCYFFDLTQMFGAGNEPTTVEEFWQRLPVGIDISEYNEGTIIDGNYGAIKTTGFNQFDGKVERGYIYYNNNMGIAGENADNTSRTAFRSKNFIGALPNQDYFIDLSNYDTTLATPVRLVFYDANKKFTSQVATYTNWDKNRWYFKTPQNCRYIRFYISLPIEEYKNTNINIAWDEYAFMNGTYQPYKPSTHDLSWISKYFPNGMRSAGSIRDEIRFNSETQKWEAVQNVGVTTIGELKWAMYGITFFSDSLGQVATYPPANAVNGDLLCASYMTDAFSKVVNGHVNKTIGIAAGIGAIRVYDTDYSDADSFKAANYNVQLYYALATPTITEITEDINMDFDVSDYGTEELIAQEGKASAIFMADISYLNNTLSSIKQIPTLITKTDKAEDDIKNIKKEIDAIQGKNIEDDELEFYKAPNIEFIRPVAKDYNGYIGEEPNSIEEYIAGDYQIKISHPYYEKHKDECLLVIMKYGTLKRNINVPTLAENSKTYFKPRTKWNFFKGGLAANDSILTINNTIDENGFVTIRNFVDKILSRGVLKWRNEGYFIVAINYGDAEDALGVEVKSYTDDYDSPSQNDFITNDNMSDIFLSKSQNEQKFGIAVIKTNPEFIDADNPMDINERHNICWSNGKYRWLISDITPFYMHVNPPITGNNTVNQHFISISK